MEDIVKFNSVEEFIVEVRGQKVILDNNVATLYGVGTKEVNQAVKNNPDKFPEGYIFALDGGELKDLRSRNLTTTSSMIRIIFEITTHQSKKM